MLYCFLSNGGDNCLVSETKSKTICALRLPIEIIAAYKSKVVQDKSYEPVLVVCHGVNLKVAENDHWCVSFLAPLCKVLVHEGADAFWIFHG